MHIDKIYIYTTAEYKPGTLVPRATNTIAVTESLMPIVQPNIDATSPMTAVTTPIAKIDTTKQT